VTKKKPKAVRFGQKSVNPSLLCSIKNINTRKKRNHCAAYAGLFGDSGFFFWVLRAFWGFSRGGFGWIRTFLGF